MRGLHRFFVEPSALAGLSVGAQVALGGQQAHQISRVLRLKSGQDVVLLDGGGREYLVQLTDVRSSSVTATVQAIQTSRPEPRLRVTLYQALVPRDRFETVLQKGTEVGVAQFVPTWCERSIVPGGEAVDEKRLERWRRIVTEAAEQCERGIVPEIAPPQRFGEAVAAATTAGPTLIAWEREGARSLRDGLREGLRACLPDQAPGATSFGARRELALFVGPEGGFSPAEIERARALGALTVSLGPRILRTETAGPVLAALALYEAGDLDPAPATADAEQTPQEAAR